jgi:hypothetical protein
MESATIRYVVRDVSQTKVVETVHLISNDDDFIVFSSFFLFFFHSFLSPPHQFNVLFVVIVQTTKQAKQEI